MLWGLKRVGVSVLLVWVVASIVFLAIRLVPGDPAEILLSAGGMAPDTAAVAQLREQLGLDRPLGVQYVQDMRGLLVGDLGRIAAGPDAGRGRDHAPAAAHAGTDRRCRDSRRADRPAGGLLAAIRRGSRFDRIASWIAGAGTGRAGLRGRHAAGAAVRPAAALGAGRRLRALRAGAASASGAAGDAGR